MTMIDGTVLGGMSGSPVFYQGKAIGILTGSTNGGEGGRVEAITVGANCNRCSQAANLNMLNDGPKCTP